MALLLLGQTLVSPASLDPERLAKAHESGAFVQRASPCVTPDLLAREISRLVAAHPQEVRVETIGESFLGKSIRLLSVGHGPKSILLWSQMHGDEPSATPALLDLGDYLSRHATDPDVHRILNTFTLRMIPMLNPDGASRYDRRNAQGIDINRDALMLATPEGRLLKSVRARFEPLLGFNLHDQSRRITVGPSGVLSSISLLAVSGDASGTITPGRLRAKRVASHIAGVLTGFIPGGIARYDEDWNPRAFGDNLTAWGSPVVLIESGGFPRGGGFKNLTRLNFIALVSVLDGLARNDLADVSTDVYDRLLRNQADAYADVSILGASLLEPQTGRWFEADLAFDILSSDQAVAGCADSVRSGSRIVEVGDGRVVTPGRAIEGKGLLLAPLGKSLNLKPGEISAEALVALTPQALLKPSADPRILLAGLNLAERGFSRNGEASFVAWIADGTERSRGRYFVVIDGTGWPGRAQ